MFKDLFHPSQSGALSEWVASGLFRLLRRWKSLLPSAGPLAVVSVIALWALLLVTGFALIYWSVFPDGYNLQGDNPPTGANTFWWSFYYSLEMLTTLGLGDIRPRPTWLRVLSALHTLLGFSLVTASITWIVLVFPALRRMRTLARKANTLCEAEKSTGVAVVSPGMHVILAGLTEEVIQSRVDHIHFPILFYFYTGEPRASLPAAIFPLRRFATEAADSSADHLIRLTAAALRIALDDLAQLIGDRLNCTDRAPEAVFKRFAQMHSP